MGERKRQRERKIEKRKRKKKRKRSKLLDDMLSIEQNDLENEFFLKHLRKR